MKKLVNRMLVIASAWIVGLLFTAAPAQAQDTVFNTYAAKFICGVQPDANLNSNPDAQSGRYSSKINVHNNTGSHIVFRKKVIQLKGGQEPTEPFFKKFERLPPDLPIKRT